MVSVKYECIHCGKSEHIRLGKKDYKEVTRCPRCKGMYVDLWYMAKYRHLKNTNPEYDFLAIKLLDENSVPRVFYKGEEVFEKVKISFDWETQTDELGGTKIHIEHYKDDNKNIHLETTNHKIGKYALGDK